MIISAARRYIASGALIGIVSLSAGCGLQPARTGMPGGEAEGWDFGQVASGGGQRLTDSADRPVRAGADGRLRAAPKGPHNDVWARLRAGFSLPEVDNPAVSSEVDWFARNQGFLERTTTRARPYLFHIVEQVEGRGLPSELALLPVVESAFQPFAYSPARAAGIWQFIPETGRRFGLRQTWWYDGRRDVLASTQAALDYLTSLHEQFNGDWLLAVAAYNCGEGAVARAVQENERRGLPTDFWNLSLPEETRGYVPRLLALARVARDPEAYGLRLSPIPNQPYITQVHIAGPVDLKVAADVAQIPLADLRHLNPGHSRWATDPDGPHHLVLPIEKADAFSQRLQGMPEHERVPWRQHIVRRGETLATLARRYGTTPETLQQVNQLAAQRVRPGEGLRVPLSPSATGQSVLLADAGEDPAPRQSVPALSSRPSSRKAEAATPARTAASRPAGGKTASPPLAIVHTVAPGETLWAVARRYGVSAGAVGDWNGMAANTRVQAGQRLTIRTAEKSEKAAEPGLVLADVSAAKVATVATQPVGRGGNRPAATAASRDVAGKGSAAATASTGKPIRYRVKPGESLWAISQRFGVTVAMLRRWNNLGSSQSVQAGQEISVYRDEGRVARAG